MSASLIEDLSAIVGSDHVRTAEPERVSYSADMWPRHQIWKQRGDVKRYPPDAVVWPGSESEVSQVTKAVIRRGKALIPYGAGCGVCGGSGIADGACECDGNVIEECGVCGGAGFAAVDFGW